MSGTGAGWKEEPRFLNSANQTIKTRSSENNVDQLFATDLNIKTDLKKFILIILKNTKSYFHLNKGIK